MAIDETADVARQINDAPNGSGVTFTGEHHIDGAVRIRGKKGLTISGGMFTGAGITYDEARTDFTVAERTRCQFFLDDCEDITFRNVRVEGSNRAWHYVVSLEAQSAWWIAGCKRINLDHCEAEWTYGDFVQIQGASVKDVGHPHADGVWVHGCKTDHIGRIQLVTNNVRNVLFESNQTRNQRRSFWDAEPNFADQIVENIWIKNNDVDDAHFEASGGKPTTTPIRRVMVRGNHFTGPASLNYGLPVGTSTISFPRREHIYWIDNTSDTATNFPYALVFKEANYVLVDGNTQPIGKGRRYVASQRSCAWNFGHNDVVRPDGSTGSMYYILDPCNVTPAPAPKPAAGDHPIVPPNVWPFTR